MANGQIFSVTTSGPGGNVLIELAYSHDDYAPDHIDFEITIHHRGNAAVLSARASLLDGAISLSGTSSHLTACLVGCAGKGLVKPLFECYSLNVQDYLSCLRGKGLSIAGDVAGCAFICFTAVP